MEERYPDLIAKIIFDDRGISTNERISKAVSNFFHKSVTGISFHWILKVPFFAISTENVGIQFSDLVGHIIGRNFVGDSKIVAEFYNRVKQIEYKSGRLFETETGRKYNLMGIKIARGKKKEAGDLGDPERPSKPIA